MRYYFTYCMCGCVTRSCAVAHIIAVTRFPVGSFLIFVCFMCVTKNIKVHTCKVLFCKWRMFRLMLTRQSQKRFRTLPWVGRDCKDHRIPSHCHGQGHLLLERVAQSPIQLGLEHFQGCSRDNSTTTGGSTCYRVSPPPK